ncbi:phospholipid carrier-dependent glycosyltransferase [Prochlorothrix hollandica]|uniref:Polyprenol-phosphate-mannose--protein mannosyltransferase n=1 Tax=Prochlorothrix hollandica PCC 9006 = CALU 1027 TaxID=317619 RepID=A0A0M2PYV1_PROHO|nr:phospholipid carrier-dependent glycosyltransferase [Prochlorothrix hollandica]KKJ01320.1 hypothetical protein PROH_02900 [Prochlorothrix hollandica PCC 9006 = CALU 1027]
MNPKLRTVYQRHGFALGLGLIFVISCGLRFWGLSRFPALVFDEVYFAQFAQDYLTQTPFFDNHPPLGKYFIALGMWLSQGLPIAGAAVTEVDGFRWVTWGYRWMNALVGSLLPLLGAAIAYELSQRRSYALVAAALMACDGLLLVESRYALINVYILALGLAGQWAFLRAVGGGRRSARGRGSGPWLLVSGLLCGASVAVKWNGLGFLLGLYGWWAVVRWGGGLYRYLGQRLLPPSPLFAPHLRRSPPSLPPSPLPDPWRSLQAVTLGDLLVSLAVVPFLIYRWVWVPHLGLNPEYDFWQSQTQGLSSHAHVGSGRDVHPYCSPWWSWTLLVRPVAYWYQTEVRDGKTWVYDVHALGNPLLWWLSAWAILFVVLSLAWGIGGWLVSVGGPWGVGVGLPRSSALMSSSPSPWDRLEMNGSDLWILGYLLLNYGANWIPWAGVSRCLFLYHHMAASIYGFLILGWLLDRWFRSGRSLLWWAAALALGSIVLALIYWLPIYLGLPLEESVFRSRIWFKSWY